MNQLSGIYGVEQSNHGHNYRWIFDKATLEAQGIDLSGAKEGICEDILFPIGGGNSSATYIVELDNTEKIKDFLLSEYYTDLDDPMLVDIAEGICTIDMENDSITKQYVKEFQIPDEMLTRDNGYLKDAESMIQALQEQGIDCDLDYENPFYGSSKDMRLSELQDLYDRHMKEAEQEAERE